MKPPLHPTVFGHLRSVQGSTRIGLHGHLSERGSPVRSASTIYRWQRSLADQFLVVPNVSVEPLGLRHAHVFVHQLGPIDCPFAVEAAWVTPDFCTEVLYLHCLVPVRHAERFTEDMKGATIVWSSSGWQQFLTTGEAIQVPVASDAVMESDLLRRAPFVLPAFLELWNYPNSLPLVWRRIHDRLGSRVKEYLPRTKIRYVNGKNHISDAFAILRREGLVRQQLIRYHPLLAVSVEVFMHVRMERAGVQVLLESLRSVLHAVESYPTSDGYLCRLLGPHRLLDAIMQLAARMRSLLGLVFFHTKRHPTPIVRFAYEILYDSKNKTWVLA